MILISCDFYVYRLLLFVIYLLRGQICLLTFIQLVHIIKFCGVVLMVEMNP